MPRSVALRRTVALHNHRKPGIPAQVVAEVIERDLRVAGGCVMRFLGAPGDCRDRWRNIVRPDAREALTMGHVREHPGGERRSVPRWLVSGCWGHGVQSWELANVDKLRKYLEEHG